MSGTPLRLLMESPAALKLGSRTHCGADAAEGPGAEVAVFIDGFGAGERPGSEGSSAGSICTAASGAGGAGSGVGGASAAGAGPWEEGGGALGTGMASWDGLAARERTKEAVARINSRASLGEAFQTGGCDIVHKMVMARPTSAQK